MSGVINFNAQIAPMEHIEKVVRQEQEHGLVKQEARMQGASERLSKDNEPVQKTAASGKNRKLGRKRRDDENSGRGRHAPGADLDSGSGEQSAEEALENGAAQDRLWSGNIVNMKV